MDNKMFMLDVSDKLEFIEDGVNALRTLAAGQKDSVGCIMDEDEYKNAQSWIFDHLMEDLMIARAEVAREIGREMDA